MNTKYLLICRIVLTILLLVRLNMTSVTRLNNFSDFPIDIQSLIVLSMFSMFVCNYLMFLKFSSHLNDVKMTSLLGVSMIGDISLTTAYFMIAINPTNSSTPIESIYSLCLVSFVIQLLELLMEFTL